MKTTTRRFVAALSLTLVLASTPAVFAAPRAGADRDRPSIVEVVKRAFKRLIVTITAEPSIPIPGPNTSGGN